MFSAQFIFKLGTYDHEFHRLDAEIEQFTSTINGYLGVERWVSDDGTTRNSIYYFETVDAVTEVSCYSTHREAKGRYQTWHQGSL